MCGIFGAIAAEDISVSLLQGLERLEYRGYDSAGLALIDAGKTLNRYRVSGKVNDLRECFLKNPTLGTRGVAHTRWATHGEPSERNAHPHVSESLAIVHNGIIENDVALRAELIQEGYIFESDTDSEVVLHLLTREMKKGLSLSEAILGLKKQLHGAYALAIVSKDDNVVYAVAQGCPVLIGVGKDAHYIASDLIALSGFAQSAIVLEDGDVAQLYADKHMVWDKEGNLRQTNPQAITGVDADVEKGSYPHYMLKEIYEQPQALLNALEGRFTTSVNPAIFGAKGSDVLPKTQALHIVACGTSFNAGLVGQYWLDSLANLPSRVSVASEVRAQPVCVSADTLWVSISQSGETADLLAALKESFTEKHLSTLAICNVAHSTLMRHSALSFVTRAGPEIGVASTKSFLTQLAGLFLLTCALSKQKEKVAEALHVLQQLPQIIAAVLEMDAQFKALAQNFVDKEHTLFLGRGPLYPIALEGALKLKELSYIHAEAYPAGELKHGPLALIDARMPVIALCGNEGPLLQKMRANVREILARGGQVFAVGPTALGLTQPGITEVLLPPCPEILLPFMLTVPVQLLSYHVAVLKGANVDQPRHLAKSVTVE